LTNQISQMHADNDDDHTQ